MKHANKAILATTIAAILGGGAAANATSPCGDLGECKVLVEINSSDGDAGLHFLMDGDGFIYGSMYNPKWRKIYSYKTRREMRDQTITETFNESSEPLCWYDPEADEDEEIVTIDEFLNRWSTGEYHFIGLDDEWDLSFGASTLSFALPAAPDDVEFELEEEVDEDGEVDIEGEISWEAGDDLGQCAENVDDDEEDDPNVPNLEDVLHLLDAHPEDVPVAVWEVVLEADFEDDHPLAASGIKYVTRIPGDAETEVEVPSDFIESLPENTPIKVEIGAIGYDDNATFTEEGDFCLNENDEDPNDDVDGCGFELDDDDDDD